MKHSRSGCSVALLDGFLYVAGGYDGTNSLDIVERYSIENNSWENVAPMQTSRNGLKLVEHKKKLYALGGDDGQKFLNTVECYDPNENQWIFKAGMKNEQANFGALSLKNSVYVVGKNSCEVYYPEEDRWEEMPKADEIRNGRCLVMFQGKLVVIGGKNVSSEIIPTVQYYDFKKRSWNKGKDMNVPRSFHAAAVIQFPFTRYNIFSL